VNVFAEYLKGVLQLTSMKLLPGVRRVKFLPALTSILVVLLPSLSHAQASRTWVSGVGDDANPGTRTAPCKTFAGAISKTAANGVIDVLDPGGFGAVTITKPVTIEGDGSEGDILVSGTQGLTVRAGANDVVILRNLTIEGLGKGLSGIQILSAGEVRIENCRINGFTQSGISYVSSITNGLLFIKDTTIHLCVIDGINLATTAPSTTRIERVNITGCGDGIDAGTNTLSLVTGTTISGNNGIGIQSSGSLQLSASSVIGNGADGLKAIKPGKIVSFRDNVVSGNHPDGKPTSMVSSE
jgi:hypothetical protein